MARLKHPSFAMWLLRLLAAMLIVLGMIIGIALCAGCFVCRKAPRSSPADIPRVVMSSVQEGGEKRCP